MFRREKVSRPTVKTVINDMTWYQQHDRKGRYGEYIARRIFVNIGQC